MNPVAPLVSLLAIAVGVWGGFQVGAWAAPDLPSPDTDPGVITEEKQVKGADPDSLFLPGPLAEAVSQTIDQLGAGKGVSNVQIEPGTLRAAEATGVNILSIEEMPVDAPEKIVEGINELRTEAGAKPITLDDVRYFSWSSANPTHNEWSVLLDINTAGPPTQFIAARDGSKVEFQ